MSIVRVTIEGIGKNFAKIQAQTVARLAERQIEEIARETERVIKQKITERIEREGSTGNLANAFTTVKLANGWGVGDVAYLNSNANYWYWMNFGVAQSGRTTPPRSRGAFRTGNPAPTPGGGTSRWNQSSTGQYLINPIKPIEAKNYIQATISEINRIISTVVGR
jgi:hypothetical protein